MVHIYQNSDLPLPIAYCRPEQWLGLYVEPGNEYLRDLGRIRVHYWDVHFVIEID